MKERILSASRIKTLETCSWSYWCSYHLKIPQAQNHGAIRGTICHLIFELLLKKRHKKHFTAIMKACAASGSPAIDRLIRKHLFEQKAFTEENLEMIDNMVWVGLNNDFFGEGGKVGEPEKEFLLESTEPKYKIKGFMDKLISYGKTELKIVDYKSSKVKFKGEELTANIQAMTYSLAALKEWPKLKKVVVEFLFLRFPRAPVQQAEISKEQLGGFEYYLEHVFKIINKFDERAAKTNYAASSDKNKWLCKAGKTWRCPYLDSKDFFALVDKEGETLQTSFENNFKIKEGQKVESRRYEGCPAHAKIAVEAVDDFDF